MRDQLDLHRQAMRHSVTVIATIGDDQWTRPTPCARWDVRQLLEHMTLENRGFAAAAGGETSDRTVWSERAFDADLRADYARSAAQVVAAFGADGVLDRRFWLPRIDDRVTFPARRAISFHLLDYVVHTWDVAAALGRPLVLADDLVAAALDIAHREVPDGPRRHRPDASFAPPVPTPEDAPAFDRLLAVLGRSPHWTDRPHWTDGGQS
jgi:uncharacterized protein (TIGR03086 family)